MTKGIHIIKRLSVGLHTIPGLYNDLKIYLANTLWIFGDRIFSRGMAFLVTIVVARYLGPEQFGILAYAISMVSLFAVAGHIGIEGLVIREIVRNPGDRPKLLGTSLVLKLLGAISGFVALLIFASLFENHQSIEFWVLIVVSSTILLTPFSVVDLWFQAHVQAKYTTIVHTTALLVTAILKITLVAYGVDLFFFAFAHVLQSVLDAFLFLVLFHFTATISLRSWSFSLSRAKELLSQGWVIFLASFFALIYLKIDQVMLKWLVGIEEVGIYAVVVTISESWYFIPIAIVASVFPKLIELREADPARYQRRLQQILDLLFILAFVVAMAITFLAEPLVRLTFGEDFLAAVPILVVHIWAALFMFMRAVFSKWVLIEGALMFSLITQGLGALSNVLLNLLLIPTYGGYGAAIATLISYAMASYVSLFFYKKTRPVFWMMTKSFVSPLVVPFKAVRRLI